jgi:hypothetical protein
VFWLYENFASQAVRDGWSALDLFGVDVAEPGEGGLAADAASWRSWGASKIYLRGSGQGLVTLWEAHD